MRGLPAGMRVAETRAVTRSSRLLFGILALSATACIPYTKKTREPIGEVKTRVLAAKATTSETKFFVEVDRAPGAVSYQIEVTAEQFLEAPEERVQVFREVSQKRFWSPLYMPVGAAMGALWLGLGIPCAVCTDYKLYELFRPKRWKGILLHVAGVGTRWHLLDVDMSRGWEDVAVEEVVPTGRMVTLRQPVVRVSIDVEVEADGRVARRRTTTDTNGRAIVPCRPGDLVPAERPQQMTVKVETTVPPIIQGNHRVAEEVLDALYEPEIPENPTP